MSSPAPGSDLVPSRHACPGEGEGPFLPGRLPRALNVAVVIVILISAASLYQHFWQNAPSLWYSVGHDRNGHYRRSQKVAFALRRGNLPALSKGFTPPGGWRPSTPSLRARALPAGALVSALPSLPTLARWAATCWFAFALPG